MFYDKQEKLFMAKQLPIFDPENPDDGNYEHNECFETWKSK